MANVFVTLPVPAADGVGAWVDVSAIGPEKTITVDGGAFGGSLYLEASNDGQASSAPAAAGPFVGGFSSPQTFAAALQWMRVRRAGSGGVGTPSVGVAGPSAISNVFGAMNVPTSDGAGTSIALSGGGDVNTFQVVGSFNGQILIETSSDGTNFVPTLIFDSGGGVGKTVVGVLNSARVVRRGSAGIGGPLVSVGSGATQGAAGGGFPGYGGTPPAIGTGAAGVSALVSRADHTHDGVHTVNGAGGDVTVTPFPGFGGAPPAVGTGAAGTATTASHSDHTHDGVHTLNGSTGDATLSAADIGIAIGGTAPNLTVGQNASASWKTALTEAAVRYFAVDYDSGNDALAGFSDVSMPLAGAVALKTLERLAEIMPSLGHGRNVYVCICSRAGGAVYLRKDGVTNDTLGFMNGATGYNNLSVRGTGTGATAGAVKFADDTADKTFQGSITATGMNAAGYNPTGAATTTSVPCTLVGGGAPGFPSGTTTAVPYGARMRFDNATATVALRNVCRKVHQVVGTDTLVPHQAWPAAPAAGDVFYLEMPGFAVATLQQQNLSLNGTQSRGLSGVRTTGAMNFLGSPGRLSYLWSGANFFQAGGDLQTITDAYSAPIGTGATLGLGLRVQGNSTFQPAPRRSYINASAFCGYLENEGGTSCEVGNGTSFNGQYFQTGALSSSPGDVTGNPSFVGTPTSNLGTFARSYCTGSINTVAGGQGLALGDSIQLNSVDFINAGATPAIRVRGTGLRISMQTPGGLTGNTDVGLDLTQAQSCTIFLAGVPTVTGTVGDVRLSDGTIISWATAAKGAIDANGNQVFASANAPSHPIPVASGAVTVAITNAPTGSPATPARYVKFSDGVGGFYTLPSLT